MTYQNDDNDQKLGKLLRTNLPVVPKAPAGELSALMRKLDPSTAVADADTIPFQTRRRFAFFRYASALAACVAIVVSIWAWNRGAGPGVSPVLVAMSEEESMALMDYAYESLVPEEESEDDTLAMADYSLDEI